MKVLEGTSEMTQLTQSEEGMLRCTASSFVSWRLMVYQVWLSPPIWKDPNMPKYCCQFGVIFSLIVQRLGYIMTHGLIPTCGFRFLLDLFVSFQECPETWQLIQSNMRCHTRQHGVQRHRPCQRPMIGKGRGWRLWYVDDMPRSLQMCVHASSLEQS